MVITANSWDVPVASAITISTIQLAALFAGGVELERPAERGLEPNARLGDDRIQRLVGNLHLSGWRYYPLVVRTVLMIPSVDIPIESVVSALSGGCPLHRTLLNQVCRAWSIQPNALLGMELVNVSYIKEIHVRYLPGRGSGC